MSHNRITILLIIFLFSLFSVKGQNNNSEMMNVDSVSLKDTIAIPPQINYDWVSFQLKLIIEKEDEKLPPIQVFVVNKIDSLIYLNFNKTGIELMRMVLTPIEIIYVNKMSEKYYSGNYEKLAHFFGIPIDFYILQSILNGVDLPNFIPELTLLSTDSLIHLTAPIRTHIYKKNQIMQDIYLNEDFTIDTHEIYEIATNYSLGIQYKNYKIIEIFPFYSRINIEIDNLDLIIDGELKSIKFNLPGPTSIKIPKKFTPLIMD